MRREYIEKIYAGWLAKVIGVRMGAPIEGWTYEKIREEYGELQGYPADYGQFAADDDTNGPIFFLRALEDGRNGYDMAAQDVGDALLNYASYESGFFWWGGYGVSTEHTAYLNLRAGVPAPLSGSIEKNGSAVAEQIGGQIFIDTWGLVAPGNPDLAAGYAEKAASVTHGGNGVYGGVFVASCISYAFVEQDIRKIIEKGLSYIPADSEYTRAVRSVMAFHEGHPEDWRECYGYVREHFGYDRYPGSCHIIPNISVMILALLYGQGDFARTLEICNMCGWDTDCNVGNVATIMGVRCGLEGIPDALRKPVNDILICSSVMGSLNIADIPRCADDIARLAAGAAGQSLPAPWDGIPGRKAACCHFEYPGSTHGMRIRTESGEALSCTMENTDLDAHTGERSLRVSLSQKPEDRALLFRKTYYVPGDFDDDRYQPSFSPILYPGQELCGSLKLAGKGVCAAQAYVHDASTDEIIACGDKVLLDGEGWREVSMKIPFLENGLLDEAGFLLESLPGQDSGQRIEVFLDDFRQGGAPHYTIDFARSRMEVWNWKDRTVSQFTRLKGMVWLEDGRMHLSGADFGEAYTGSREWDDYNAVFKIRPECNGVHLVNVRVQGALRSYAAGFGSRGRFGFYKNDKGYRTLAEKDCAWEPGREYTISVACKGNRFAVLLDGRQMFDLVDEDRPYLEGCIGLAVRDGGHISCTGIEVTPHPFRKLLFGTGNRAKLEAMRHSLSGLGLEIAGLQDMDREAPPVPEDGETPLENARQKALAYYDFYQVPVFSCDSGLYFDDLPQELQPGIHVRTVGGKYLSDEEMLEYYGGLAERYGDIRARYRNAICLVLDREHIYESMDESIASEVFLLTSVPHSRVRQQGFPLDSLSVEIGTGKYYYDLDRMNLDQLAVDKGMRQFFQRLGL